MVKRELHTLNDSPWMCHHCGAPANAATPSDGKPAEKISDGDVTMCLECGAIHIRDQARWRQITEADWVDIEPADRRRLVLMSIVQRKFKAEVSPRLPPLPSGRA